MNDFTLPRVTLLDWLRFKLRKPWFVRRVPPKPVKRWITDEGATFSGGEAIMIGGHSNMAGHRMKATRHRIRIP